MKAFRFSLSVALCLLAVCFLSVALYAAPIDLTILNPNQTGSAGDVITFQGTITNNSGADLDSTDLFLDFFGYDPMNVQLDQLLGMTSFTIPDGTTSPVVDLFTFSLATTAGPGTYWADVVLQDASGDASDTNVVSVTITPEPSSIALMLAGACGILLLRKRWLTTALPLVALCLLVSQAATAQVRLVTGLPGFGSSPTVVTVATPITNSGTVTASNVQVNSASLKGMAGTGVPQALGAIAPGGSAVAQENFNSTSLLPGTPYLLTVRGTYQVSGTTYGFSLNRYIKIPPSAPGSDTVGTGSSNPISVSGAPFPPVPPQMDNDVNVPRPPIPTGAFVPGTPTPTGTGTSQFPSQGPSLRTARPASTVIFGQNSGIGTTSPGTNCNPGTAPASCAEPTGAEGGGVIFVTANWMAAYSTDGGSTFTQLNPTTIFPADTIGFCCDQVVQYVPSIDRFIWVLQGNGYRVASASPQQIIASSGTSWTYWNLDPTIFGEPSGTGFDYPDTSIGDNSLYINWDVGFPKCPAGCKSGRQVVRIPLSQIAANATIFFEYTHPEDASLAWGSHLTQDTGDEIFWAGHNQNNTLRVWSWAEGSNTYFWRDIGISTWANNTLSSPTPDGNDWFKFGFPGNSIIGSTRSNNQLWFAWTAGTDNNFQQDHVEMVTLDRNNNFNKIQQVQIWNSGFAFGYPALATNRCTGEVGLSLTIGGGGGYENHAVGFWGDFLVYTTTNSGSGVNRFGDYLSIRQNGFSSFSAMGYGISTVKGQMQSDVRYVTFGRICD